MQPSNSSMNTLLSHQQFQMPFDPTSSHDDFLEQMLSSLTNPSSPWADLSDPPGEGHADHYNYDDQSQSQQGLLAAKLRHHQINGGSGGAGAAPAKALMLQQQLMLARNGLRPPSGGDNGLLLSSLSNGNGQDNHLLDASFKSANPANENSVEALLNGFGGSIGQGVINQFMEAQNVGGSVVAPPSGLTGAGAGASAQPRQPRIRARRGQATDPHSIAERLRRERIAERMKSLQELVPNANKTDKASMLDEIIDYVKFLQLQVKVLSVSRLGGATAVAPLVADMSSEAGGDRGRRANRTQTEASTNKDNTMTVTEHQVAKLMEEDMGSAMQYLQGKGLCLMPISLATAISTATCHPRNPMIPTNFTTLRSNGGGETGGPPSPNMSALSVQSATVDNVKPETSAKDVDC